MVHYHCTKVHISNMSLSKDMGCGQTTPQTYTDPKKLGPGLKSDSHLPRKFVLFTSMKATKNDEKCISF